MAGYGANVQKGAQESLVNRGITDPGVSQAVASNVKAGLSGAYAAAHGALAMAKVNAQTSTNKAMVNYKMGLAQRQYDATMAEYAAKNGIWGTLGGLGTGIMGLKSGEVPSKSEPLMMDNPKLNLDILGGK